MHLSALFLLSASSALAEEWIPQSLRNQDEFDVQVVPPPLHMMKAVRKRDGVTVQISWEASTPKEAGLGFQNSSSADGILAPSTLPLGFRLNYYESESHVGISVRDRHELVHVSVVGARREPHSKPDDLDVSRERLWCERLAREALARTAGRRLRSSTPTNSMRFETEGEHIEYVELSDWAKRMSVTVETGEMPGTYSFVWNDRKHRFALGASQVEVDGKWGPLPDVVMIKDDKVFVPVESLRSK